MESDISKANKLFDTELLIELVKSNPALYNSYSSSTGVYIYRQSTVCNEIWKDISGVMEKEVSECRAVWTSLRAGFKRHLKNLKYNAIETNRKKKKPWYLAEKMEFLTEYMQFSQYDRRLYRKPKNQDINSSVDDNSTTFSNLESKNGNSNDNFSIKSNDTSSETTLSTHEKQDDNSNDCVIISESAAAVDPQANNSTKNNYQVEQISTTDQNILTPKENGIEEGLPKYPIFKLHQEPQIYSVCKLFQEETPRVPVLKLNEELPKFDVSKFHEEPPKVPESKRFKMMSSDEVNLTSTTREDNQIDNSKAREASTLMFFQSMLFDLRKLSDRKLRLLKQDILKDMNKYLDEDDDDD